MWFVVIGCLLLVMKLADFGFAATLSWLWVLAPFGLAVRVVGLCRRQRPHDAARDGQDGRAQA